MTTTTATTAFTWSISQMEHYTADGVVFAVFYSVDAHDGSLSAGTYGSVKLEAPESDVIPYADLTPEIVIGWVQSRLGGEEKVDEIQAALQKQLNEQRAPSVAQGLPWTVNPGIEG
jgi:hypothetical protein